VALIVGGLLMTALYIPFTIAHGPTWFNEGRQFLGRDMYFWGMLLGVEPNILIGAGFWSLRRRVAGTRRLALVACTAICIVLWLSAVLDLVLGGLGLPFGLFLLGPAALIAGLTGAVLRPADVRARHVLGLLGLVLVGACIFALVTLGFSDSFGGFRIFGILAYVLPGLLWAVIGWTLLGK
jgi:hypothetical protein